MTADAQQLRDAMFALLHDEATGAGDPAERAERAGALAAALAELRTATDEQGRVLVSEASRYLEAIQASQTQASSADEDLVAEARRLTEEIQQAALAVAAGELSAEQAAERGRAFSASMDDLLRRAGLQDRQAQVAAALHDADLDVGYVTTGGNAPVSLSLRHRLSG